MITLTKPYYSLPKTAEILGIAYPTLWSLNQKYNYSKLVDGRPKIAASKVQELLKKYKPEQDCNIDFNSNNFIY